MTEVRWKESVCRAVAIQVIPDKRLAAMPASVGREHLPGEDGESEVATEIELIRSTESEKGQQIENVGLWQQNRNPLAPEGETDQHRVVEDDVAAATERGNGHGLGYLQKTARERRNVFEALVEAVKTHSLGQISHALYDVGEEYRRNM